MTKKTKELKNIEEEKAEVQEEKAKTSKPKIDTMESLMEELGDNLLPFKEGDVIEATVLAASGNRVWVDVSGQSLGFIPEREISARTNHKKGDKVFATVLSLDNEDGNVVLSMRQADREKYWVELEEKFESGEPISITVVDANKGGLITEIGDIQGFLPVSQLSPKNYPRVQGGDKEEILGKLRQLVNKDMMVKVINCDRENQKLIFSEKAVSADEVKDKLDKFKVGDKVKGKITGVVDFGLFVNLDPQIEGLVHISEVSWSRVSDLNKNFKVGSEVEVMIISLDNNKVSLSLKRLENDPWAKAAAKYKVGDVVDGEVSKVTPFGAFVSIEKGIDGLVHISELSSEHIVDPGQAVELGKAYKFKIISIEPESHRLGLSKKAVADKTDKPKNVETKEPAETEEPKNERTEEPKNKETKELKNTGAKEQSDSNEQDVEDTIKQEEVINKIKTDRKTSKVTSKKKKK